jgi:uncharacterized damage-inducible protein DinB
MSHFARLELLHGQGSHADPIACIEDLSADQATKSIAGFPHTIAQLVFHMNYWMDYELRRIRGQRPAYPQHSTDGFPPTPFAVDEKEWNSLKENFAALLSNFAELAKSRPEELNRQIESLHPGDTKLAGTLEAVIWQMVAHNSYHTGQIVVLRRAQGAWPPPTGGDAW